MALLRIIKITLLPINEVINMHFKLIKQKINNMFYIINIIKRISIIFKLYRLALHNYSIVLVYQYNYIFLFSEIKAILSTCPIIMI